MSTAVRFILHRSPWRALGALLLVVLAASCGGGGGVDTGGTGGAVSSNSSGRISGFGSIVVNGVHFDESTASIVDDDDQMHARDELELGMTVNVEAGPITTDAAGTLNSTASKVQFGSEIRGPVESVSVATNTLHVLGQTVMVDVNTVIAGLGGTLAGVHAGDIVQVFAFFDPSTGIYTATRLEHQGPLPSYKLRGPVASLDTTARTFKIGAATITYATIAPTELPGLANGTIARVDLMTTQVAGRWIATRIRTPLPGVFEGASTEVEGFITDFRTLADFKVDGVRVNASGAGVVFTKGNAAQLVNGARVEAEGTVRNGVLIATRIEVRKPKDGGNAPDDEQEFELRGKVDSLNLAARTFVIRRTTVHFDTNTLFEHGTLADLRVDARIDVKGVLTGGSELRATRIEFDR